MEPLKKFMKKASPGGAKIWVTIIVLVLGLSIYAAAKIGPVYSAKWEFEDYLKVELRRLAVTDKEEMFGLIQTWADQNGVPVEVWEDCHLHGKPGGPGEVYCDYVVDLHFFQDRYIYPLMIHAEYSTNLIPTSAN